MPDDDDASPSATCTFTPDELNVAKKFRPDTGCSRPVWEEADAPRCVWHADGAAKPPEELAATVGDGNLAGARARESDLTPVSFPEDLVLMGADLTGANLRAADLSKTYLLNADLTGANLRAADLSETYLSDADLTRANLYYANLSGADLRGAVLRNALLSETTFADVSLARSTIIGDPEDRIRETYPEMSRSDIYDRVARTNHKLRTAYSENGLTGRARRARVRERTARRKEAHAEENWLAWGGSLLSKVFTGYGVQLRWIMAMMVLLYIGSAGVYWLEGMAPDRALYYSVVTFTTSPPEQPPLGVASVVAGIETFAGTAATVFLGYALGTREQV